MWARRALNDRKRRFPALAVTVGRSFFSQQNKSSLGAGSEIWHGHHQSLRYCQAGMLLNFDLTATAFIEEGPVLAFAQNVLHCTPQQLLDPRGIPDHMRQRLANELKGLRQGC